MAAIQTVKFILNSKAWVGAVQEYPGQMVNSDGKGGKDE